MRRHITILTIAAFLILTIALLLTVPNALRYGFPALAAIAAAVLFVQSRTAYIRFCFWLWFLSPMLRRMVDFRTEFVATSPLLLAPFLAASVSGVVLIKQIRTLARRENSGAIPFACALFGIAFGTIFGLTRYAPIDVARGVINWIAPVLFAFFLYQEALHNRERYLAYRATVVRTLLLGTLLLSIYGIVQFFLLLPWDEAWMLGLKDYAFGQPFPRELRVFSTMNAPATFASYAMAGLLIAFAQLTNLDRRLGAPHLASEMWDRRGKYLAVLTAPLGLLALALTTSRSLWLGLVFGILYLALALPSRARVRVVASVLITLVFAAAASQAPGINEVISARIKSFTSGTSDISASARIDGHAAALAQLATEPLGEGMGSVDTEHATDGSDDRIGPHDSTLLEFLYALGGPGTLLYAFGLGFALWKIFFPPHRSALANEPAAFALRAIVFAFFAQCLLTSIMIGVPGFLVWTCLALALAVNDLQPLAAPLESTPDAVHFMLTPQ